jgi:hypothetical protein
VFFNDYDHGVIYHYDKGTGAIDEYLSNSQDTPGIVANAGKVYWTSYTGRSIGWGARGSTLVGEVTGQSFNDTWAGPWSIAMDTGFVYWCDRDRPECWRIDLPLTKPELLYTELLPDGGVANDTLVSLLGVDPGSDGYVFFTTGNQVNRMAKDGGGLVAYSPGPGQSSPLVDNGYVYWTNASGAIMRSHVETLPTCDAGACGEVVVPANLGLIGAPQAFDSTYVYFVGDNRLGRALKNGTSTAIEIIAQHTAPPAAVAVDDVAIYYVTPNDNTLDNTGSFWRVAK